MQYSTATTTSIHRPRSVTGAIAVVLGVVLTAVGLSAGPSLAFTGPVATPNSPDSNQASYWGAGCTKLNESGDESWKADASYSTVVLKSGTTDYAFSDVVAGDVLTIPQEISHFVFCPPTTTTTSTTTTTVDEATTTTTTPGEEATTTTAVAADAPTTTALVAQAGPTTTETASSGATIVPTAVELPRTGGDTTTSLAVIGGLLLAAGMALLSLARRRTVA